MFRQAYLTQCFCWLPAAGDFPVVIHIVRLLNMSLGHLSAGRLVHRRLFFISSPACKTSFANNHKPASDRDRHWIHLVPLSSVWPAKTDACVRPAWVTGGYVLILIHGCHREHWTAFMFPSLLTIYSELSLVRTHLFYRILSVNWIFHNNEYSHN